MLSDQTIFCENVDLNSAEKCKIYKSFEGNLFFGNILLVVGHASYRQKQQLNSTLISNTYFSSVLKLSFWLE